MKKRFISIFVFILVLLSGCGDSEQPALLDITQIDIYLTIVDATGALIIELRCTDTAETLIWSDTVDIDTIDLGLLGTGWVSFPVSDGVLEEGRMYRIYVYRSDTGNPSNRVTWRSTFPDEDDHYAHGTNDVGGTSDFSFRTYIDNNIDQFMEETEYGYAIWTENNPRYQEFTAGAE